MLKRLLQRWCLAALAFVVAALTTGVSVQAGLECLLVFTAVYATAALVQRRQQAAQRRARHRARPGRRYWDGDGDRELGEDAWPLAERL